MTPYLLALLVAPAQFSDSYASGFSHGGTVGGTLTMNNDFKLRFGTSANYWFVYNSSSTQFELWTTNSDGAGADALVLVVDDGTKTLDVRGGRITNGAAMLQIGTTCTASHSEGVGDYCFGGVGEFEGNTFFDGATIHAGASVYNNSVTLEFGTSENVRMKWNLSQTSNTLMVGLDNTDRAIHFVELADVATNFGFAAQTDPTLVLHASDATDTTKWISLNHNGTNGVLDVGKGVVSIPDGITTAGTIVTTGTATIGWSVVAGANTACTTTCTTECVVGFDTGLGGSDLVDCADATADRCLCAGAN